mgnify:CR=1 FL=1
MGREANVVRDRVCFICGLPGLGTAKDLVAHALVCKRLGDAGLVAPDAADNRIIVP